MVQYFERIRKRMLLIIALVILVGASGFVLTDQKSYTVSLNFAASYQKVENDKISEYEKKDLLLKGDRNPNLFLGELIQKVNFQKSLFEKINIKYNPEDKSQGLIVPAQASNAEIISVKIKLNTEDDANNFIKNAFDYIKVNGEKDWLTLKPDLFKIDIKKVGDEYTTKTSTPVQLRVLPAISALILAVSLAALIGLKNE